MAETVTVDVSDGTLRGIKTKSKSGNPYYSFQGVPFAKPPIGSLRFKVAQPPEPWSGVRDAIQEGSKCTQFDLQFMEFCGSEDCLYLNIYSPQLPSSGTGGSLLPVMVWIHGGGFVCGSGSADIYGPDYLVDQGVVVVNINYRLGILGFLCLKDPVVTGNIGLKDQVAALRWVQKNISNFGGDHNNVTIFGESAGGAAVHFHMLSPMSKGLFHRAIAQSGAALNPWAIEKNPRDSAFRLGEALGFKGHQPDELLEFLRGVDHMSLVKAAFEHGLSEQDKERMVVFPFVPTLETEAEGVERFLTDNPIELLEEGRYHNVPYMTGVTDKEGLLLWKFLDFNQKETVTKVETNFEKIIIPDLHLPKNYRRTDEVAAKIRHFFLKDKPFSMDTLPEFIDMFTDIAFVEGVHITVKKMAQLAKSPLYYYKFSHDGGLNFFKAQLGIKSPGACHADELGYLFDPHALGSDIPEDPSDVLVRDRMVKLWTNFAKTGNPTPEEDPLLPVTWKEHTAACPCYLEINKETSLKKHLFNQRIKFWEELYRTL